MTDIVDTLYRRFQLIGYSVGHLSSDLVWRWQGFDQGHKLDVNAFKDGGKNLDFRRANDSKAALFIENVRPLGELLNPKQELLPIGACGDS